jgi:pimeloyl-ACP methyl ester carboxylesterase
VTRHPAIIADTALLGLVKTHVLLIYGRQDGILPPPTGDFQKLHCTGSRDVTLTYIDNAAHTLQLERTAPTIRSAVAAWLSRHGF